MHTFQKKEHPLLVLSAFLISLIAVLHAMASMFYFYWKFEWFDSFMHILGGMWAGSSMLWLVHFSRYRDFLKRLRSVDLFTLTFFSAFFIGVAWEMYEYIFSVYYAANYILDTALDLLMDLIGASIAYGISRFLLSHDAT